MSKKYSEFTEEQKERARKSAREYAKRNPHINKKSGAKWRAANKAQISAKQKVRQLKRRYEISQEKYDEMLLNQNNSCAICQINKSELEKNLSVDHCHSSGAVRGLLCQKCNAGLGMYKENIEILLRVVDYLNKHKQKEAP